MMKSWKRYNTRWEFEPVRYHREQDSRFYKNIDNVNIDSVIHRDKKETN